MFHHPSENMIVIQTLDMRCVLLTAGVPGQGGGGGEADHEVEDGPGHDHAVVHVQEAHLGAGVNVQEGHLGAGVSVDTLLLCVLPHQHHGGGPRAPQQRAQPPHQRHAALAQVLAHRHL